MPALPNSGPAPDIAIIGGGIIGLWASYYAGRSGANVLLIEKGSLGSGASGGFLGALMPHQPTNWDAKKQFQLDGLMSLPAEIATLENETGVACGYRRCGRIMPIHHASKHKQSLGWANGAARHWPDEFSWDVSETLRASNWIAENAAPSGANHDTLSARIEPRALITALVHAIRDLPNVSIAEQTPVASLAADHFTLADGTVVAAGRTIVAAGHEGFGLLGPVWPHNGGRGVKGQAALLKPTQPVDPASPILYDNGTYVIAHENGTVAVGSTSENEFDAPDTTDGQLDVLVDKARALCPAIADAEIIERWAGVRPRATGRDPVTGPLPAAANIIVATGGFKITFAIAHLMAQAAVAFAQDRELAGFPDAFRPKPGKA